MPCSPVSCARAQYLVVVLEVGGLRSGGVVISGQGARSEYAPFARALYTEGKNEPGCYLGGFRYQ
jgi:hypothetical protein